MSFSKIIEYSHQLVRKRVNDGDFVVDATLGRGNDTLFLANLVGKNGKVYSFDIQKEAIEYSYNILESNNLNDRVDIINDNHEKMANIIDKPIKAIMFNLGYLPGGDKEIITKASTTIGAIKGGINLLENDGIITIVVYVKHDDGFESNKLNDFLKTLPQKEYSVIKYQFINQINFPAYLLAIEKCKL